MRMSSLDDLSKKEEEDQVTEAKAGQQQQVQHVHQVSGGVVQELRVKIRWRRLSL